MSEFWRSLLGPEMPPHGHCYLWNEQLVTLHVVSDVLITLSYFTIPVALIYLVRRREDLKFNYMFLMFAVFIFACGATHLVNILNVWYGAYWLSGSVKAVTALASVGTAILVWPLIPKALALPSNAQLVELNRRLQAEVTENRRQNQEVERLTAGLRELVDLRTEELAEARLTKTLLEKANESLSHSNTALEEFSRASSESFVEPLRVIDVYSKRLQERGDEALVGEPREWLEKLCDASQQVSKLNAGLLRYLQLPLDECSEEVNVDELLDREMAKIGLDDEVTVTRQQLGTAVLPVKTVALILGELLGNAARFRSERPLQIEIGLLPMQASGEFGLYVRDNGRGIPASQQQRVFTLFEHYRSEGPGVGLAAVRRLVHEYGGSIDLISDGHSGSEFQLRFPPL